MENGELRKLLADLQEEIKNTKAIDPKGAELLRNLDADIKALIERSGKETAEPAPLNLEEALTHFEVSHPTLSALIEKLLEALSNSGI